MSDPKKDTAGDELIREAAAAPYEPILPVEKKLIIGSLLTGALLLGLLLWISQTYFPVK